MVVRVRLLGDDAFESSLPNLLEELLAAGLDVVGEANRSSERKQPPENRLAVRQGKWPQVEFLPAEKVEGEQRRRQLGARAANIIRSRKLASLLKPLKAGDALIVKHHQLAIDHQPLEGESLNRRRELGKQGRCVPAPAKEELRGAAVAAGEQAVPVVFELEQPALFGKGLIAGFSQHQVHVFGVEWAAWRPGRSQLLAELVGARVAIAKLIDGQIGEDGLGGERAFLARPRPAIALLDQQPLFRVALGP